jgi:hypothetical protein
MCRSIVLAAATARSNRPETRLYTLLLVFLFAALNTAQQSRADEIPTVPKNVAPHPAPVQPLPFSHKTHVATGLECQTCHTNPDPGSLMTFPATEMCMSCHVNTATDKTAITELQAFAESGQKIPWVRVYAITPGVTWGHRAHLVAGTQCENCHGDISRIEAVSETTAILAMATCISCHETRGAMTECVTCHAWPTDQFLGIK